MIFVFRGPIKTGYRYTDAVGMTHGGYLLRSLKSTWTVIAEGKERFIKRRVYPIRRHHD